MADNVMERIHNANLGILTEVDRICRKYHLHYYLIGGALLGITRSGGFIPWDDDVDILMFREDFEKFMEIYQLLIDVLKPMSQRKEMLVSFCLV